MNIRNLSLSIALLAILATIGCGFGSGSNGNGGFPPTTGNFSKSSLSGHYTYQLQGYTANGLIREAGVLTADGNGNITAGIDDFADTTGVSSANISGTYTISDDGTGEIALNISGGGTFFLEITMVSSSKFYAVEVDNAGSISASGTGYKQSDSDLAVAPSGTFAFTMHGATVTQSSSTVGVFTASGGAITAGDADVNRAGAFSSITLTGSFDAPDASGTASGQITDSTSTTTNFYYYIVDANTVLFFTTDSGTLGLGRAEKQSGTFSTASLNGGYAFGSAGDTTSLLEGTCTAGRFTADGAGGITGGIYDSVEDGTVSSAVNFTGTYAVAANGRATITLNPSGGGASTQDVAWLVNSSRAFFLVDDALTEQEGTLDKQSGTFTSSSLNGQYAFSTHGVTSPDVFDQVGLIRSTGGGTLLVDYFLNFDGNGTGGGPTSGSYSVDASGRVTATDSALSNATTVFYMISPSEGYMIFDETGTQAYGRISIQ